MRTGKAGEALPQRLLMLEREHRRRREKRDLLAVHHRLERGAHRDFGLAVADVAAEQAIHRRRRLHVALDVGDRGRLIGRQLVLERVLELLLPVRVGAEGVAGHRLARGVELEQLLGHVAHRLLDARLGALPRRAAEPVERRPRRAGVLLDRDRAARPGRTACPRRRSAARGTPASRSMAPIADLLQPDELADAVIDVDDQIADLQIAQIREERLRRGSPPLGRAALLLEDVGFGVDLQPGVGQAEAARQAADRDQHRGVARVLGALDRNGERRRIPSAARSSARRGRRVAATNSVVSPSSRAAGGSSATQSATRPWISTAGWQRTRTCTRLARRRLLRQRRIARCRAVDSVTPMREATRPRARPTRRAARAAAAAATSCPRRAHRLLVAVLTCSTSFDRAAPRLRRARKRITRGVARRATGNRRAWPRAMSARPAGRRAAGRSRSGRSGAIDRCVAGSYVRSVSIVSPMNSRRTGCASPAGKMSTMPPRIANSPCSSAGSSRVKPASTSSSARSVGAISWPGLRSSDASAAARAALTRGSSAAADATTTRAVPVAIACSARARADVTPKCGASPRYGSTSCDGKGRTARRRRRPTSPSSADEEEAHVGEPLSLDVAVARHDVAARPVRQRLRRGGDEQRLRRRRSARTTARTGHPCRCG